MTAGVPTVWLNLINYMQQHNHKQFKYLKVLCIAGSAPPRSMIETLDG